MLTWTLDLLWCDRWSNIMFFFVCSFVFLVDVASSLSPQNGLTASLEQIFNESKFTLLVNLLLNQITAWHILLTFSVIAFHSLFWRFSHSSVSWTSSSSFRKNLFSSMPYSRMYSCGIMTVHLSSEMLIKYLGNL